MNSEPKKVSLGSAIIFGAATLLAGLAIGFNWDYITTNWLPYIGINIQATADWSELNEVYNALEKDYDGEIDLAKLKEGAKKGLVAAVGDQYTTYMTKEEAEEFKDSLHGNVGNGIGVELAKRDNYVRVIRTLPDNPARKAGVLAGDIIYKINDEVVYDWTTENIALKLRGEAGSTLTLTVVRDGEQKSFDLTREAINNVSAYVDYDGNTAIITVTRFDNDTGTMIQSFANEFKDKGVKNIILDLRGNGGDYVSAAKDLLSLWIDGEKVVTQKSSKSNNSDTYADKGKATLKDYPTVVLVNSATASASEITASALQDYQKGYLIGEQTYGKGVVQTLDNLSNSAILKVTAAHWYSPSDKNISGEGITPDLVVENTYEDTNAGRDPQMDAAKNKLKEGIKYE